MFEGALNTPVFRLHLLKDDTHMRPQKLPNFQDPHTLSIYIQNVSTPLTLAVQF